MDAFYLATFETDKGKTVKLKIGRAKPSISVSAAKTALGDIVTSNVLNPDYGRLTGATALQYVTVTRTPLDVA